MFQKILVPTDGSEYSIRALALAVEMAKTFASEILLLHVVVTPEALGYVLAKDAVVVQDQLELGGASTVQATCRGVDSQGVKLVLKQVAGHPVSVILEHIQNEKIDLVVMGSHGYSPIKGSLLGSVSQKVLAKAPTPVMLVK